MNRNSLTPKTPTPQLKRRLTGLEEDDFVCLRVVHEAGQQFGEVDDVVDDGGDLLRRVHHQVLVTLRRGSEVRGHDGKQNVCHVC